MAKMNYLNLGCGDKYHQDWVNVDKYSNSRQVIATDLFKRLPFKNDRFEVVYLSQVLEHFPKDNAVALVRECYRVLKSGGIMRIVVPDLEDIAKNYLKFLEINLTDPSKKNQEEYDWMLLEMYDQVVRNTTGGEMTSFLKKPTFADERFIFKRAGFVGKNIRDMYLLEQQSTKTLLMKNKILKILTPKNWRRVWNYLRRKAAGGFRQSGEVHYWMYDRYSLKRLLENCGFKDIKVKSPSDSDICDWGKYELDMKDGQAFDPVSLFMEAKK